MAIINYLVISLLSRQGFDYHAHARRVGDACPAKAFTKSNASQDLIEQLLPARAQGDEQMAQILEMFDQPPGTRVEDIVHISL